MYIRSELVPEPIPEQVSLDDPTNFLKKERQMYIRWLWSSFALGFKLGRGRRKK